MAEAHKQEIERLQNEIAYSEGFRDGVAESIESHRIGVLRISCSFPQTAKEKAYAKGHSEGDRLLSEALMDVVSPAEIERHNQALETLLRAHSNKEDARDKNRSFQDP
jgi:hypothetical protein